MGFFVRNSLDTSVEQGFCTRGLLLTPSYVSVGPAAANQTLALGSLHVNETSLVPTPWLAQAIVTLGLRGPPIMDNLFEIMDHTGEHPLHGHVDLAPKRQTILAFGSGYCPRTGSTMARR